MNKLPQRKNLRLKYYNYSQPGYYFITICTKDKKALFGNIVDCGRGEALPNPKVELTKIGQILLEQWQELKNRYNNLVPEQLIIMPNHIHGIIIITAGEGQSPSPTLGNIIGTYKSLTTKLANKEEDLSGRILWQRSYYDRVIRNEKELISIRDYINNNPMKWLDDEYHI